MKSLASNSTLIDLFTRVNKLLNPKFCFLDFVYTCKQNLDVENIMN